MRRFFADRIEEGIAHFGQEELAHISKVLRLKEGDIIIVPEGRGEWICELFCCNGEYAARLLERRGCDAEPKKDISLFLAYTKSDKMELCVQKAVELGANAVYPFISSRCVKIPDERSAFKANQRFLRIAHEAVKQCGRSSDIRIELPMGFDEMLSAIKNAEIAVFAYENAHRPLKQAFTEPCSSIALIIGPEGGFTDNEAESICNAGAITVSLGTRILRAETAAVALLAITSYETEC